MDEFAETRGYRSLGGTVSATPGGAVAPMLICDDHIDVVIRNSHSLGLKSD